MKVKIQTGTWKAPGITLNQIDNILYSKLISPSIISIRSARGPNCDLDHIMIIIKYRERQKNAQLRMKEETKNKPT